MAFDTNGTNAVLSGTVSRANQDFTVCTWVKIDVDLNDWSTFFAVDNGGDYMLWQTGSDGVTTEGWWDYGGSSNDGGGAVSLTVGTWYFVAGVFDAAADTWTCYIMETGGSSLTEDGGGTGLNGTATLDTLRFGEWHSGEPLNGRFRNAKWFDAALTTTELLAEAQNETIQKTGAGGRRWDLVADANVDEGTGNLTVSGTATWPDDSPDELAGGTDATATPAAISVSVSLPAVTATGEENATATPAQIAVAASMPAATAVGESNATSTPAAISTAVSMPAVTATGEANGTPEPDEITIQIDLPAVSTSGSSASTATPGAISTAVTIPAPSLVVSEDVDVDEILTTVSLPSVTVAAEATVQPDPITVSALLEAVVASADSLTVPDIISIAPSLPGVTILAAANVEVVSIEIDASMPGVTAIGDAPVGAAKSAQRRVATSGYLLKGG